MALQDPVEIALAEAAKQKLKVEDVKASTEQVARFVAFVALFTKMAGAEIARLQSDVIFLKQVKALEDPTAPVLNFVSGIVETSIKEYIGFLSKTVKTKGE